MCVSDTKATHGCAAFARAIATGANRPKASAPKLVIDRFSQVLRDSEGVYESWFGMMLNGI